MAVRKPYFSGNASIAGGSPPPTVYWLGEDPGPPYDKKKIFRKDRLKCLKQNRRETTKRQQGGEYGESEKERNDAVHRQTVSYRRKDF